MIESPCFIRQDILSLKIVKKETKKAVNQGYLRNWPDKSFS